MKHVIQSMKSTKVDRLVEYNLNRHQILDSHTAVIPSIDTQLKQSTIPSSAPLRIRFSNDIAESCNGILQFKDAQYAELNHRCHESV